MERTFFVFVVKIYRKSSCFLFIHSHVHTLFGSSLFETLDLTLKYIIGLVHDASGRAAASQVQGYEFKP
jgi:hypothetical protein